MAAKTAAATADSASEPIRPGPSNHPVPTVEIIYDDDTTRTFVWASVLWGLIGLLVGLLAAIQLSTWRANFDLPYLTFSRIRPLHTNAVIFALVGNMMFAGVYYSTQRLLKARMASDLLSKIHLWGWQVIIVGAAITLPLGITQSKEYAELEWFLDIAVTLIWVVFALNFFWTIAKRNEKNLYVAIWFYIATILTVAVLYIVNNLALPVLATKSYGVFAGAQDALTQWWYGHNAVAFFLTTPILGIMYYFLPKAAERPVYSYRLSIVHFWALVFIYIWAGPHHLLYTALPDWAQSLGMVFSLMLWAPSWGGMLNGLLTLRGAWHKVRTDPVLKFFVAGVTFYGMATFEGPMLAIKSVSALGHYTEWIIGHVHGGALGWNGLMAAGMFYWLVPRLFGRELHSKKAADMHFWIATMGILLYVASMWIAGITQGLMWRGENVDGSLQYGSWGDIIQTIQPLYWTRTVGGSLFIVGWIMMAWNLMKTAAAGAPVNGRVKVVPLTPDPTLPGSGKLMAATPVLMSVAGIVAMMIFGSGGVIQAVIGFVLMAVIAATAGTMLWRSTRGVDGAQHKWHSAIEARPLGFSALVFVAVVIGGVVELVPGLVIHKEVPLTEDGDPAITPYTALQLEGRDIYIREGCYVCHSQMIRPFRSEALRYGPPSRIEESIYDHPFQWGSKRTGPDLARIGGKYTDDWHYDHMLNPRKIEPRSNMPSYVWLKDNVVDVGNTAAKMAALGKLGVPYSHEEVAGAKEAYFEEAERITAALGAKEIAIESDRELVALIGYLQRLGTEIGNLPTLEETLDRGAEGDSTAQLGE